MTAEDARHALLQTDMLLHHARAEDLARQTPCEGWDLGALLGHMVGEHEGFRLALGHGRSEPADHEALALTAQSWRQAWETSRDGLAESMTSEGHDPVIVAALGGEVPRALALSAITFDLVIHGWDIATTLALPYRPDPRLVAIALRVARSLPEASRPGAFAPAVPAPGPGPGKASPSVTADWAAALRLSGRDPQT